MRLLKLAALIVFTAFPVFAQETANPVDQYPVGGATDQTAPREVIKETFGDWEIRCTNEGKTCFMYQLMLREDGTPVAELSFVKLPLGSEAVAGATVVAPLGTLLTRGLAMQVDEKDAIQYPFTWCARAGCFSRFGLTDLMLNDMKKGAQIKVAVFSISNAQAPVIVTASLDGFTDAFEALEAPAQ